MQHECGARQDAARVDKARRVGVLANFCWRSRIAGCEGEGRLRLGDGEYSGAMGGIEVGWLIGCGWQVYLVERAG